MSDRFLKNVRISIVVLGTMLVGIAAIYFFKNKIFRFFYLPAETKLEQGIAKKNEIKDIEVIAENLAIPWELAFLPDGDILVTERLGNLKRIGKKKHVYTIEGVRHAGEGGLLGLALHPRFTENHWIYLYFTTASNNGLKNKVERYRLDDNSLSEKQIIIDGIPGAPYHDGGRIAFGQDGYLYVATGDAGQSNLAQDTNSLAGKILRLKDDGQIPHDNPFSNAIYSYGHRNPQGLAWDNKGRLWATEHGRSGILSGLDELNLIDKGKNYGWPVIQGDEKRNSMESPIIQSGAYETWAPAGLVFFDDSLFFGGLRGESIYRAKILDDGTVTLRSYFHQEFGRIRTVVLGPDGFLYITTSNTDGRGKPKIGDDKIIRINPKIFK